MPDLDVAQHLLGQRHLDDEVVEIAEQKEDVAGLTTMPTSTSRRPTTPATGARTVALASADRRSSTVARACSTRASAWPAPARDRVELRLEGLQLELADQPLGGQRAGPHDPCADLVDPGVRFDGRRLGHAQLGLGLPELLGERLVVEPHQRLADGHRIAVAHQHLDHGGADLGPDRHLVARAHHAAQLLLEGQAARPGRKRLDGRRCGRRAVGGIGPIAAAGDEAQQHRNGNGRASQPLGVRPRSAKRRELMVRCHLEPPSGTMAPGTVTRLPPVAIAYFSTLLSKTASRTAEYGGRDGHILAVVRGFLNVQRHFNRLND